MKILHINCNYIGTTLHQLMVERLDDYGYENSVFVPTYSRKIAVIKPNDNVCVSECFKKWDRLLFDYKQSKILKSVQKEYDIAAFDCIHAYTLFTDGNCAMHLAEKHNIPFVVAVRNTDVNTFFKYMPHLRKRGIEIMRKAARVFFLSEAYKKQVFEKYIPCKYHEEIAKKTLVIPNGIDDFWFGSNADVSHTDRGDTIKLIYAGRIDENKNIPTTQRAVQILNDKGYSVRLTVVGRIIDQKEFARIQNCPNTTYIDAAHNTYIDILYYLGLIGGALLMVILVQLTNMLPKPRSRNLLNYSVVGTILIMYVFLSQLFYFDLAFQIMLAIIVLRLDITKRRDRNAGSEEVFRSNYL